MAGKSGPRKKLRYRFLGAVLLIGATAVFFLPFKISLMPFLEPKLEAWKKLGIRAEKISISPRGRIHAQGVTLGSRETCRIGELDLDVALSALMKGRLVMRRVQARHLRADWEKLDAFLSELQRQIPAHLFRQRLASFEFRGSQLEIAALVPDRIVRVDRVRVGLRWRPSLVADVESRGVGLSGFESAFTLPAVSFRFLGRPKAFRLEGVQFAVGPVELEGGLSRDSRANLEGRFVFRKVDLGWLTRTWKSNGRVLEGVFLGEAAFTIPSGGGALEATGNARGVKVRVGHFPFQQDVLVRDHMPVLRDVRFDSLRIAHWRLRPQSFQMDSMVAVGSPLSVEGGGRLDFGFGKPPEEGDAPPGKVYFAMVGHLTEAYYKTLGPLVQSGLYRDFQGRPSFRFKILGDFEDQEIRVNKVKLSRVVKSLARGLKERLRSLVKE